jgi:signal transduction histidine kinase
VIPVEFVDRRLVRFAATVVGADLVVTAVVVVVELWPAWWSPGFDWPRTGTYVGLVVLLSAGLVIVRARPRNPIGRLLLGCATALVLARAGTVAGHVALVLGSPVAHWLGWVGDWLWVPAYVLPFAVLPALYPSGRPPSPIWWCLAWTGAAGTALSTLSLMMACFLGAAALPVSERTGAVLAWGAQALVAVAVIGGIVAMFRSVVRARPPERQQRALLLTAVVASVAGLLIPADIPVPVLPLLAVAVAAGLLRYRLLGIEIVLRRGLVYAALTAGVLAVYLACTALGAQLLGRTPLSGVMAAVVVAVGFTPAREQLQRAVDRFVHGRRPDPVRALGHFGDRVAEADETELLHTALESVAESVGATGAAVVTGDGHIVGSTGAGACTHVIGALRFGGRDLGTLRLATRYRPPRSPRPAERRLHSALTAQVAVVVRATRLTDELKAEHDRFVGATRTERDRLRRDLHDGLGPSLSGVGLGLQALTEAVRGEDATGCEELLARLGTEVATAVRDIHRIIEDLRPAALDRLTLVDAVRRHAGALCGPIAVTVTADPGAPLPPEVEAVAYRIVTEALTNVARHASAHRVHVGFATRGRALRVSVTDDGAGGLASGERGIGLNSMARRAEALNGSCTVDFTTGGTTVVVDLPWEAG